MLQPIRSYGARAAWCVTQNQMLFIAKSTLIASQTNEMNYAYSHAYPVLVTSSKGQQQWASHGNPAQIAKSAACASQM